MGLPGFWRRVGCMCDYVVLPLLNSSFEPGRLGRLLRVCGCGFEEYCAG